MVKVKNVNIYIETDSQAVRKTVKRYGAAVEYICASGKAEVRYLYGCMEATYNQISLVALSKALGRLKMPCCVTVYMGCDYVKTNITQGYADRWCMNGWKNERDRTVANAAEWKELMEQAVRHRIDFACNMDSRYRQTLAEGIRSMEGTSYRQQSLLNLKRD